MLRHYLALSTSCFLSKSGDTTELPGKIAELFERIPDFEEDVHAAQASIQEKTRVQNPDCDSPENHFGPCEFHIHRVDETCYARAAFPQSCTVYVGDLPPGTTEGDLKAFFKDFHV